MNNSEFDIKYFSTISYDTNYKDINNNYDSIWIKEDNNLICTTYGCCKIETIINDVKVCIEEITSFPFEYEVKFIITVERPVDFCITFQIPPWAKTLSYKNKNSISLSKIWKDTEEFTLLFKPNLKAI